MSPDREDLAEILDEAEVVRSLLDASLCSIKSDVGLIAPGVASQENLQFSIWSVIVCASARDVRERDMESGGSRDAWKAMSSWYARRSRTREFREKARVPSARHDTGRGRIYRDSKSKSGEWPRHSQDCASLYSPPACLRAHCM